MRKPVGVSGILTSAAPLEAKHDRMADIAKHRRMAAGRCPWPLPLVCPPGGWWEAVSGARVLSEPLQIWAGDGLGIIHVKHFVAQGFSVVPSLRFNVTVEIARAARLIWGKRGGGGGGLIES